MEASSSTRRRTRLLLGAAVVLVAVVAAGLLFLASGAGRAWLGGRLMRGLGGALAGTVVATAPDLDLLGGALTLDALEIHDQAGSLVVGLRHLELDVASWGLVGDLHVRTVTVEGLELNLAYDDEGVLNLTRLPKPAEPEDGRKSGDRGEPGTLQLDRILIADSSVTFGGNTLRKLDGELTLTRAAREVRVTVAFLSGVIAGGPTVRVSGEALFGRPMRIEVPRCELKVGDSILAFHGTYKRPDMDVTVDRLFVAVPELMRAFPEARLPAGLGLTGTVAGTMADLVADVRVDAGTGGTAHVSGVVGFFGPPKYDLELSATDVDLASFTTRLPPTRIDIAANLRGKRLMPERAEGTWNVTVSGTVGTKPAGTLTLPVQIGDGALRISGGGLPEAGIETASAVWDASGFELTEGDDIARSLGLEIVDARGRLSHLYELGAGTPARKLRFDVRSGWVSAADPIEAP